MRKSLAAFIICILTAMLLAGCAGNTAPADKPEDAKESAETSEDEDEDDKEAKKPEKNDEETEEPEDGYVFAEAFRKGQVGNNGHYFVKVGDKVYFRNISPESMEKGVTFGEFLNYELYVMPCPLISYDLETCEWEEIGTVAGTGELYACPQGFYIGENNQELSDASCTNLYDPAKNETSYVCAGLPLGVSESGEILAVEEAGGQCFETVLLKNGKETARIGGENIYYEYVGFAGETLITMLHNANEEYILCSVDEDGEITELGMVGDTERGYGVPKQFRYIDGSIYLCVGYYEGTGNFLSRWDIVKATPGVKGSLEIAINGDDEPSTYEGEGPDPDVPVFFFDTGGALDHAEHVPYQAYMGYGDKENDLFYYDDIFEEQLLVEDFIDRSDYENCSIIQDMESIAETVFVIYADAEADSEYDIGWRMGYSMTGWHICAIPFGYGHLDDKGLAKKIIYFQGGGGDKKLLKDADDAKVSGDPLKGLVADDILTKFRESNPVKNPGSVEKEAQALGTWVQKSIKNLPAATKEKGEKIGLRNEFWFGTDIGNNFDANFAGIYAAYYALKDYYTSDGTRSADFYDSVMEENEFMGSGDPGSIEKMYDDMQGFVTDCNNIIRGK